MLDDEERAAVIDLAPNAVAVVADLTVDPAVFEELGYPGEAEAAEQTSTTGRGSSRGWPS